MATNNRVKQQEDQPRSLTDLLKISLKLSDQEMKEWGTEGQKPMDEERKKWLKEAMDAAMLNDDTKRLKACIDVLKKNCSNDPSVDEKLVKEKSEALDEIQFLVELSDNANDLNILGGLKLLIEHLQSSYSSLRWKAAEVIATACQNNPILQNVMTNSNGIPLLVELVNSDDHDVVRVKALYALSSLSKGCEASTKKFMDAGGIASLLVALSSDQIKLRIKAAFFVRGLITLNENHNLYTFVKDGLVTKLLNILKGKHDDSHEHVIILLHGVILQNKFALLECRKPEHGLRNLFSERREILTKKDPGRYQEEIECYGQTLKLCFPTN